MNQKQMINEYLYYGFSQAEIERFLKEDPQLLEKCDYCESCRTAILHVDDVFTDAEGRWLCAECG